MGHIANFDPEQTQRTDECCFRDIFAEHLEKVPLQLKQIIQLKHDGAPTYLFHIVRYYMNLMKRYRWIERPLCLRSSDLTHIDFFLWEKLKIGKLVYATSLTDAMDLVAGIDDNVATIQIQESDVDERVK